MGLMFMVLGGLLAMLVRWQLAWPTGMPACRCRSSASYIGLDEGGTMPPDFYTMAFTMHATIMIFFVIIPLLVGTFGNYLIPLKIGAGDMAFPFLNGLAFWSALPAGRDHARRLLPARRRRRRGLDQLSAAQHAAVRTAAYGAVGASGRQLPPHRPPAQHLADGAGHHELRRAVPAASRYICAYYVRLGNRSLNVLVVDRASR